jgi:RNA recognition motif-containing protein
MRIYVGNLSYNVTSDELRSLFEPFGEVLSADVQYKARTGQSRGFGLVEMVSDVEAEAAIHALNGKDHQGRALTVNESRPRRTVKDQYASGGWYGVGGR